MGRTVEVGKKKWREKAKIKRKIKNIESIFSPLLMVRKLKTGERLKEINKMKSYKGIYKIDKLDLVGPNQGTLIIIIPGLTLTIVQRIMMIEI